MRASDRTARRLRRYDRTGGELASDPRGSGGAPDSAGEAALEADLQGMGMRLFLASLTMVFGGTFVAYAIIWWKNRANWEGILDGKEIGGLAAATVLLVLADVFAARALKRAPDRAKAWSLTRATIVAATVYLVVQGISWVPLLEASQKPGPSGGDLRIEGFLFLMLTFAHAAHVLGGIVANFVVLYRSRNGAGPRRASLRLLYQYWRFLTIVWIAVLAALFAFGRA